MTATVTHADTAPFVGRLLLATADADEDAFFAAVIDAASEGVDTASLLVVIAQALVGHLHASGRDWRSGVRQGLLEVQAH